MRKYYMEPINLHSILAKSDLVYDCVDFVSDCIDGMGRVNDSWILPIKDDAGNAFDEEGKRKLIVLLEGKYPSFRFTIANGVIYWRAS